MESIRKSKYISFYKGLRITTNVTTDTTTYEIGKPFQKCCGQYCYDIYHPVDENEVIKLAYQYSIVRSDTDPDHNYYKALQQLRSKVICKHNIKCCNY